MLDGNSSPWLRPQQGVYVFSSQPTILYPSPSTTAVTTTSGHSEAYLYAYGSTGTGYFDLGTTTGYGLIHEAVPIPTPGTAWLVWDDWGPPALQPGYALSLALHLHYHGRPDLLRGRSDLPHAAGWPGNGRAGAGRGLHRGGVEQRAG